jgi:hypothetical protein
MSLITIVKLALKRSLLRRLLALWSNNKEKSNLILVQQYSVTWLKNRQQYVRSNITPNHGVSEYLNYGENQAKTVAMRPTPNPIKISFLFI